MMKKLRVGIIGNGGICQGVHAGAYLEEEERVEIVALCDIIKERAEMVQDNNFEDAKVYTDYKELLKDETIDAVDICTPNYWHSKIAVDAFAAGKHVFCEKPDAISVEEAEKMFEASKKAGKVLMVMRNNRFIDISQYAKKFIEEGNMGEVYAGRCGWIRRRGIPGKGGWFTTKALSGGGPLIDLGVHMIDLAVWLMGNPTPVAVSGATYCKFADNDASDSVNSNFGDKVEDGIFDVEDLAMGFIRFDNGAVLQIEFSWASNIEKETRFVELRGTKAGLCWDPDGLKIFTEKDGKQLTEKIEATSISSGHGENISHFVDILTGESDSPCFQPQQGIDMIKILSAIYESAKTGRQVSLI
ncbi:MAG: Gfo/Idh/MocA family oxidoreductase [Oscillospiraceae bacterium]|jgi:predicted dehydrogenase|nr:Gfo/Idh/MocA family oxidoreductase [Oscillospiraceae bacterium]